jgi:hypothetical protein
MPVGVAAAAGWAEGITLLTVATSTT